VAIVPHGSMPGKRRAAAQSLPLEAGHRMNDVFQNLGIESWKPVVSALVLPPVPWLALVLVGARLIPWQRLLGWLLVLLAVAGLWLSGCAGFGDWLVRQWIAPPPPLTVEKIAALKKTAAGGRSGVVVLMFGGGREALAPEYGVASLSGLSLERLRYGVWLSRETGAPMMFSGGLGHAAEAGTTEAEVAAEIAQREFLRPLRWVEPKARDTRENAQYSAVQLREQEVTQVVLVTHGWHMPRALRAMREASTREQAKWEIVPAPMGLAAGVERASLRWIPSSEGTRLVRSVLREKLGWLVGS
jgi:uncharacterized SAM-binding protein YcdF (DUF218 family)